MVTYFVKRGINPPNTELFNDNDNDIERRKSSCCLFVCLLACLRACLFVFFFLSLSCLFVCLFACFIGVFLFLFLFCFFVAVVCLLLSLLVCLFYCATNSLQHVGTNGQGAIVCKWRTTHGAVVRCSMPCTT